MNKLCLFLSISLSVASLHGENVNMTDTVKTFNYQNPIKAGLGKGIRDCQILKEAGKWYMTGTVPNFFKGDCPGVRLFSSDNLTEWKDEGLLIDRSKLEPSVWFYDRFWAPELHKIDGRWHLVVSCCNESKEYKHGWGCCLAVSDKITGPYEIITKTEPIRVGIDMTLFHENGKTYGFWDGISFCEVDLKNAKLIGKPKQVIELSKDKNDWDSYRGLEGPWCFKYNDKYYLFYSSFTRGYEVGYARADSLEGPWIKGSNNPIYGDIAKWNYIDGHLKGFSIPQKNNPESPFEGAGHNAIFEGPDGKPWLSCHVNAKEGNFLAIDPLKIDKNGNILYSGPSFKPQSIILSK